MVPEIVTMGALVVALLTAVVAALALGGPNHKRLGPPRSEAPSVGR